MKESTKKYERHIGITFLINDEIREVDPERIEYLVCFEHEPRNGDVSQLVSFARTFSFLYRLVLVEKSNISSIGVLISVEKTEEAETKELLSWIISVHKNWHIEKMNDKRTKYKIIGYRIPNNPFHAKKLQLQGEIIDGQKIVH